MEEEQKTIMGTILGTKHGSFAYSAAQRRSIVLTFRLREGARSEQLVYDLEIAAESALECKTTPVSYGNRVVSEIDEMRQLLGQLDPAARHLIERQLRITVAKRLRRQRPIIPVAGIPAVNIATFEAACEAAVQLARTELPTTGAPRKEAERKFLHLCCIVWQHYSADPNLPKRPSVKSPFYRFIKASLPPALAVRAEKSDRAPSELPEGVLRAVLAEFHGTPRLLWCPHETDLTR